MRLRLRVFFVKNTKKMTRHPTLVQCDKRGQIVIPKNIRLELGIDKKSGFIVYSVTKEGILLKRVKLKK